MPARTLGLAEVEVRLQALRRQLNLLTTMHIVALGVTTLLLAGTLLVLLRPRATAAEFRLLTWGVAALGLGVGAVGSGLARRRWVDLRATAHLADQRGQLADRLATLHDLSLRPRRSRLAPVLLAQSLGLGDRWRPQQILPRRLPRSIYLLPLALIGFLVSPLAAPTPPPLTVPPGASPPLAEPRVTAPPPGTGSSLASGQTLPLDGTGAEAGGEPHAVGSDMTGTQPGGTAALADKPDSGAPHSANLLGLLPDRIQRAIRREFRADQLDAPRALSGGTVAGSRGKAPTDRSAEGGPESAGDAPRGQQARSRREADADPFQPQAAPLRNQQGLPQAGDQAAQRRDAKGGKPADGTSPPAGEGSSPEGLMDVAAEDPALSRDAPATFKVTLGSFLRAVEQKGTEPHQPDKRIAAAGAAAAASHAPAELSNRQLRDDALRKAEIPPEYEDIVRRVYSLRPDE